jgi:hypothetical protein
MAKPSIPYSATFSYGSFSGYVTGLQVEHPTAETVNMTGTNDPVGTFRLVPTGEKRGGSITVDFMHNGTFDVATLIGTYGSLTFSSTAYSVSKSVICETASMEARTGEVVRGTLKFLLTDYTGG